MRDEFRRLTTCALAAFLLLFGGAASHAQSRLICRIILDTESGAVLLEEGDCTARVTPASTFKLPLAVAGFDAGLLQSRDQPVMHWQEGEPDWGGASWRGAVTPAIWMRDSVVWYSQRLTRAMGAERLTRYASDFGYGNADFSGDPGFDNGLERAWIASSLQVSPREQVQFLARLLGDDLPASAEAQAQARAITVQSEAGGWRISGKTGAAYPRRADRSFDRARGYGWFVGWAERGGRRLVFAHLRQDMARHEGSPGRRSRDAFLADWPQVSAGFGD
ncbi:class D beta-lactamase [Pararhodobacter oceanensis]|uniref:class D beta-lactamase n=1 Tax=Pararhodobacter oceanensis TaxID=2172121 RepID=UPI003A8F5886